jgi:hypothetical protein
MTEPSAEPQGASAESPWGRPLGALVSPQATFRSLAARPSWLPPLLGLVVLGLVGQVLFNQKIDHEAVIRDAFERQGQPVDEEQVEMAAGIQRKFGPTCGAVVPPLFLLLAAAIFWGLANVAGGEIDFKRSLSVTVHGMMPTAVAGLLTIPVVLGREEIEPIEAYIGLLASHLGVFATDDTPLWLLGLLARVDLFSIWVVVLLVIGFRRVAGLSIGAATAIVLVLWALMAAVLVALTMMQGGAS